MAAAGMVSSSSGAGVAAAGLEVLAPVCANGLPACAKSAARPAAGARLRLGSRPAAFVPIRSAKRATGAAQRGVTLATASSDEPEGSADAPREEAPADKCMFREVTVQFSLQQPCMFGQKYVLVGSHPVLGEWSVDKAIRLNWSEGDVWIAEAVLPAGDHCEYKYLLLDCNDLVVTWQPGNNMSLDIPDTANDSIIAVLDTWDGGRFDTAVLAKPSPEETGAADAAVEAPGSEAPEVKEAENKAVDELTKEGGSSADTSGTTEFLSNEAADTECPEEEAAMAATETPFVQESAAAEKAEESAVEEATKDPSQLSGEAVDNEHPEEIAAMAATETPYVKETAAAEKAEEDAVSTAQAHESPQEEVAQASDVAVEAAYGPTDAVEDLSKQSCQYWTHIGSILDALLKDIKMPDRLTACVLCAPGSKEMQQSVSSNSDVTAASGSQTIVTDVSQAPAAPKRRRARKADATAGSGDAATNGVLQDATPKRRTRKATASKASNGVDPSGIDAAEADSKPKRRPRKPKLVDAEAVLDGQTETPKKPTRRRTAAKKAASPVAEPSTELSVEDAPQEDKPQEVEQFELAADQMVSSGLIEKDVADEIVGEAVREMTGESKSFPNSSVKKAVEAAAAAAQKVEQAVDVVDNVIRPGQDEESFTLERNYTNGTNNDTNNYGTKAASYSSLPTGPSDDAPCWILLSLTS
eukprot:jgi/Chlat1/6512/Chrsp45S06067